MSSIPGWILVAFSVDKTLSMRKKPIVILKKKSFQWSVVAAIVLANLILYIEIPITLHLKSYSSIQNILYCDLATLDYFKPFIIINLLETTIIPFGIMVISSMITIRLLYKSRRSLEISGRLSVQRRSKDVKFAISSLTFCFFIRLSKNDESSFLYYVCESRDCELLFSHDFVFFVSGQLVGDVFRQFRFELDL